MKVSVSIMGMDCTNNGVTSGKENALLIVNEEIDENQDSFVGDIPVLKIVSGRGGREYIAVPVKAGKNEYPMFGGQFIYTSDSRFPFSNPIHVHDRYEK